MTDSLKFGPEWLRNLTQPADSSVGSGGGPTSITPRYQLADYRYGREEMLAIFGNIKPCVPDGLDTFPMLFLEKPLPPLALIQMTEEETRMWQRGINSEVAVRSTGYGRGSGPIPIGGRGLPLTHKLEFQQNSSNYGPGVGRGRGRFTNGRGRFDEDTPREPGGGFPVNNYASRGRFDRSVSGQERSWTEKGENGVEWSGGAVSPRREMKPFFGKPPIDNWRNNSIEGDEGAPVRRPSGSGIKWNRASSWRNESGGKDRDSDWHGEGEHGKDLGFKYSEGQENDKDGTSEKRYGIDPSFKILDAIKEVKEISLRREVLAKELDELDKKVKFYEEQEKSGSCQIVDYAESFTRKHTIQSDIKKLGEIEEELIDKIKHHLAHNPKDGEMGDSGMRRHRESDLPEWATSNAADEGGSFDESGAFHGGVFFCEDGSDSGGSPLASKLNSEASPDRLKSEGHKNARNKQDEDRRDEVKQPKQVSHVKPIIPQYEQEHRQKNYKKPDNGQIKEQQSVNILPLIMGEKSINNEKWPEKLVDDVVKDEVVKIAEESVVKEEFWFYLDPQGFEQGKFSTEQMLAWTKSGFFPPNLQVRRDSDSFFADICRFTAIWEQTTPAPEPVHNEIPLIPNALKAASRSAASPTNNLANSSGKVFENVRGAQTEIVIRQFEEVERMRVERLSFEPEDGYVSPDESFEAKNFDKQMIWNELKREKERREMHKGMGGTFANYLPLDPSSVPGLKPTTAWITQWMQKQYAKIVSGKKRFLPEEKELLILCKLHEKKLELDSEKERGEKVMRVMPNLAPGDSWHLPQVPSVPESVWGNEPSPAPPTARLVDSLWGDMEPIPMPQSVPTSLWGMASTNGLPQARHQFTGQFDKVEADALELEKLAAEATSRRESHRREENMRIQKEIEAAKKAIEIKRLEEEKKMQEEAEKQRQEMIARQIEMEREKERMRLEQEMKQKKMEEEAAAARRQMEMEKKLAEEEERRRKAEEKERKKAEKAQEEALKKQQQARKKELEMQSVQQVEAQMKLQLKKQKEQQKQQELQQQELQRQLEIQRQQEMRKQQEIMMEQHRKAEAKAAQSAKATKMAPWLQQAAGIKNSVTSLAEIQKLQKEEMQKEMAAVQEHRTKLQLQQSLFVEEQPRPWEGASQKKAQTMLNLQQIQEEQKKNRMESTVISPPQPAPAPVVHPISNTWNSAWTQPPPQISGIWGQTMTSKVIAKPVHSTQPAPQMPTMPASIWNADPEPAQSAPPAAQKTASAAAAAAKKKNGKNKSKKEEAQVMKIFESKKFSDDFTSWCVQSLSALESDVDIDIPTFVSFLKDIESPYDINDYVRSYLGNGQEAREFAKNFIEKRSKWRNSQKKAVAEDDMCKPAAAINPRDNDFVEVKGAKKPKAKKKQMTKLDSRILGFSVTAAPDRLNVGDRDYGE